MSSWRLWIPPLIVVLCAMIAGTSHDDATAAGEAAMAKAASHWLASLSPELRKEAVFSFDDDERKNWHYFPMARKGISTKRMNGDQRRAAFEMMKSALSSQGYLKVSSIIALEAVLQQMERDRGRSGDGRDPEHYYFTVFGDPGSGPWGWRVEGHHLSLNFSSVTDSLAASTPLFLGANPANVTVGPLTGMRVLGAETDLAFDLVESLDDEQLEKVIVAPGAPGDVFLSPGRGPNPGKPIGLAVKSFNPAQRALVWRLIEEYADNLKRDLASYELDRIRAAGIDEIHFAWAGPRSKEERHYYRLHGPTFVIEYDATQGGTPGHVHTLWRDPKGDFGEDLLRRHRNEVKH